jgi:hypothetical protein
MKFYRPFVKICVVFCVFNLSYQIYRETLLSKNRIMLDHHEAFDQQYLDYLSKFGKSYSTEAEFQSRKKNFVNSLDLIQRHKGYSFELGLNTMSDWFDGEFNFRIHSASKRSHRASRSLEEAQMAPIKVLPTDNLKESIDWREVGAITKPLSQGDCGACWALTAASALEAAHFI